MTPSPTWIPPSDSGPHGDRKIIPESKFPPPTKNFVKKKKPVQAYVLCWITCKSELIERPVWWSRWWTRSNTLCNRKPNQLTHPLVLVLNTVQGIGCAFCFMWEMHWLQARLLLWSSFHTKTWISFYKPEAQGGTHFEKGYGDVRPLRPPFHALSAVPWDPHFSMFQFFKTPFSTKITNFTKFVILEPNFMQTFHSKASIWPKFSSLSPIFSKK